MAAILDMANQPIVCTWSPTQGIYLRYIQVRTHTGDIQGMYSTLQVLNISTIDDVIILWTFQRLKMILVYINKYD